jgi:alpha-galactosidase
VRCVAVEYADYPAVEWTVYFKNTGTNNTPILENIQGLDTRFERGEGGEFVLHGNKGDWCVAESFEPFEQRLEPGSERRFAPVGGRPTNGPGGWPYYNVQRPGGGFILAIGWPGQWASSFSRDGQNGLRIVAGQEQTRMVLKPGEEIRSPLIALLFWSGDDVNRAQNTWRRWMLAHNLPRPHGKPVNPIFSGCASGIFMPSLKTTEKDERQFIDAFVREQIQLDYWWIDAGWYPCSKLPSTGSRALYRASRDRPTAFRRGCRTTDKASTTLSRPARRESTTCEVTWGPHSPSAWMSGERMSTGISIGDWLTSGAKWRPVCWATTTP